MSLTAGLLAQMSFTDNAELFLWLLVVGWVFLVGSCIGSFLNVVVYRTVRGMSVAGERSFCPKCGTPIWGIHNIPILGWLMLKGRCRACHLPISPRYPLVEAFTGLVFALLVVFEGISGGANLPGRTITFAGPEHILRGDLPFILVVHATLLSALISWSLMEYDGFAVPRDQLVGILLLALVASVALPGLHSLNTSGVTADHLAAGYASLLGFTAGCLSGWLLGFATRHKPWIYDVAGASGVIGALMGYQAVLHISAFALVPMLGAAVAVRFGERMKPIPPLGWLLLVTIAYLLTWPAWTGSVRMLDAIVAIVLGSGLLAYLGGIQPAEAQVPTAGSCAPERITSESDSDRK